MAPLLPSPRGSRSLAALLVASAIWAPAAMRDVQVGWQPGNGSTATGSVIRVGALVRRCGTLLLPCAGLLDYHMSFFTELNSRRGGVLIGGVAHPLQLEAADVSDDAPEEAVRVLVEEKGLRLVLGPLDPMISAVASHIVSQAGGVFVSPAAESGGSASPGIFTLGMPAARTFGSALRMFAGLGATSALFIHSDDAKDVEKCTAASSIAQSLGITTQEVSMFSGTWMEAGAVDVIVGCFREEQACYTWINVLSTSTVPHKAVVVDECPQYNDFLIRTQHNGQFVFSATLWPPDASVSSPLLNITNFGKARGYDLEGLTAMAAGEVLVTAIEAAGSVEPSAVTAAIQAGHFSTLVGSFRFNAAGAAEREAWVLQRQWSTQASVVSPPSLAVVAPRYPHPDYVARRCFSEGNKRTGSGLSDPGDVESCKRCPDGQEAFTPEGELFQLCRLCPAGSHAWSGTEMTCKQCLPGSFAEEAGQSRCDYCAAGRFMQDYNATACEDCPAGLVSRMEGQSQCEACIGNGTRYASRRGMAFCEECPEGATCEGDEQGNFVGMTNQLGWWHIEGETGSKLILRCVHGANPEGRACQPGHQCISFEGEPLMEGAFCGTCRKDHGRVGAMDICQRCDQVGEGFLVLTTVLTCLLVLMTFVSNIVSKTRFKGTRTVVIKQIISYMIMVSVAFEYTDHKYPFGIGVGNLFRDLVSISGLRGGGLVRRAAQCLSWKLFPETQFWKACTICGCLIAPTMVATEFAVFKVLSLLMRVTGRKKPPWRHMMGFVTITLFVLLPRVNGLCLMPMNCFHFDQQRLLTDTEVLCDSDEHVVWQIIGCCGFTLNSLGIPLTLYLMLRFYNTRDMLEERSVINMLGFLYQGFEPHCYYFEVVNMMRNVLVELAVDVPFLATQTPADMNRLKCATLSILHGLFLFVHLTWQPYDNRMYFLLDRLETASLTATWSTTLLQTWLQVVRTTMRPGVDRDYSILQDVAGWLVLLLHLHFWGIIFCSILRSVVTEILARRTKAGMDTVRRKRGKNGNVLRRVYKRWMSPGNVVVTPNGFQLRALSEDAQRLYTQMFAELLDLLTEDGEHDWEMYLQAVQHVCINAYYQRIKTRKSGERPLLNMINNAQEVVKHMPCSDWLLNTLESIKDRIGSKDHLDPEVEHLQYLTEKNISNILGREFTVEELHCALLRLGSSVRDEKLSKAEADLMQASDAKTKTSLHRLMSMKTGRMKDSLLSTDEDVAEASEFYRGTTIDSAASPQAPCPRSPEHWTSEVEVPRSVSPGWVEDRPPLSGGKQIGSRESTFPEPEPMPADEEAPLPDPPPSPTKTRKLRPPAESKATVSPQASPRPPDPAVPQLPSPTTPGGPQLPPVSALQTVAPTPLPCGPIPEGKEQTDEKELQSDGDKKKGTKQEMYVDMHRLALRADEVYSIFDEPKSVTKRMFGGLTRDHTAAKESTTESV